MPTSDPIIPQVRADFATSLVWTRSPFQIPVEVALAEIAFQPITGFPDTEMPCLSPIFQFVDTILHLFREAWFERWLNDEKDVNLMKFGDVVRLWQAYHGVIQGQNLIQVLEEFDLILPVVWVLEHLDRTLHTDIVTVLGLEGQVTEQWLSSAHVSGSKGDLREWRGTMRTRLNCKDRRALFLDTGRMQNFGE